MWDSRYNEYSEVQGYRETKSTESDQDTQWPPYALTVDFGLNIYLKCTLTTTKNNKKKNYQVHVTALKKSRTKKWKQLTLTKNIIKQQSTC